LEGLNLKERELWLEYAKGIGIFLVVMGHVNLGFLQANMFKSSQLIMKYIHFFIYSFHMPLFFIISGYLYSKTWNVHNLTDYKRNITKKVINLGIPYIIFSIFQGLIKIIMSSSVNSEISIEDIIKIPFKPINQFWYVYALIGIFAVISLIDVVIKNNIAVFLIAILFMICKLYLKTNIPIIDLTMYYSFYFYIGKLLCVYKSILEKKAFLYISILLYSILCLGVLMNKGVVYMNNIFTYSSNNKALESGINLWIMISVIMALLASYAVIYLSKCLKNRFIAYLGKNSFQIYLLHIIFASGIRIVLMKLHVTNILAHYVVGIGLGVIMPLLIYSVISKIKFLDFLFFPYKNIKSKNAVSINAQ
jgi:fucose 4-O-acetylase-like acetyltransferase